MRPLEALSSQLSLLSILHNVDNIEEILEGIENNRPDLLQQAVDMVKDAVQEEARVAWKNDNFWSILVMATGSGKSKIPINVLKKLRERLQENISVVKVLIAVPTEKLRDNNWREEFIKWDALDIYEKCVETICYASLSKIENQEYDLFVGDEFHNMTENNVQFFKKNKVHKIMGLTATQPKEQSKLKLFKMLKVSYNLPLDIAIRLRLVADYAITVVNCKLDNTKKIIKAGNKQKTFMVTEKEAYEQKCRVVDKTFSSKFAVIERTKFIKNLPSKVENAKFILEKFFPEPQRTLIFCGGIEQAIELCPHRYFSKPSAKKDDPQAKKDRVAKILPHYQGDESLIKFIREEILRLSCIAALNEGHNFSNIDGMLNTSVESGDRTITQQIGRTIRFRIGHKGNIVIMCYPETQEYIWLMKALAEFDQSKITTISIEDLKRM